MHTELFHYCSFSTHRYTLKYFSTANSIQSWHFVIYVWINPCIIWPNFVHEFGSISCLFIVKIIVMPWNTRQVTDPSLQRCHINVADMNMHVFTKSCVWIKTEHFFLMVSMDLELLWICSCWMFCSPSFVLAFRAISCHDKTPGKFIFLPPTSQVCFAGKNLEFTRLAEVVRLGGWWCCYWLILLLSAFVRPFSSRWTRATSLCAVNVLSSSFEFVVLVSLNVEVP